MKNERRGGEDIKKSILNFLDKGPSSVKGISDSIGGNWITVNNYLEELKTEKKVKEIISTDKVKFYQKVTGDTYFDLPITDDERKKFKSLFYLILQGYKEKNIVPKKTHFSKAAVSVINNPDSGLSRLPTIWYLYGMIPLMMADPSQDYKEEIEFENKTKIKHLIKCYIDKNCYKGSLQLQKDQHKEYNEELYVLADEFLEKTKSKWGDDEILSILEKFFIACPIDEEFPEVFEFTDRFVSTVSKLKDFSNLQEHKREILLTFEALWKYIATYKGYKSISNQKRFPNNKIILDFYIGNILESRKIFFQESFSELYPIYWDKLSDKEIDLSPEAREAREIMKGWTGED